VQRIDKIAQRLKPARVITRHAKFANETLGVVCLQPVFKYLKACDPRRGRRPFLIVGSLVRSRIVAVEVEVRFVDDFVQSIVDRKVGIDLLPHSGRAPAVTGNDDIFCRAGRTNGIDRGLSGRRPNPGTTHVMRFVHQAKARNRRVATEFHGHLGPEIGKG